MRKRMDDKEKESKRLGKILIDEINEYYKDPDKYKKKYADRVPKKIIEVFEKYKTREEVTKALGQYITALRGFEKIDV